MTRRMRSLMVGKCSLYVQLTVVALLLWSPSRVEPASTRVIEIDLPKVVLAAGSDHGLQVGARVKLLRQSESIIHPLTGEDLGTPFEPVGFVEIVTVGPGRAVAKVKKLYSQVLVDDIAEYKAVIPDPPPHPKAPPARPPKTASIADKKIDELAHQVAQNQQIIEALSKRPAVSRKIWDEIAFMKSFFDRSEERLEQIERRLAEQSDLLEILQNREYGQGPGEGVPVHSPLDLEIKLGIKGGRMTFAVLRDSLEMIDQVIEGDFGGEEIRAKKEDKSVFIIWGLMAIIILWLGAISFLYFRYIR